MTHLITLPFHWPSTIFVGQPKLGDMSEDSPLVLCLFFPSYTGRATVFDKRDA
jgi:hypothetical protein